MIHINSGFNCNIAQFKSIYFLLIALIMTAVPFVHADDLSPEVQFLINEKIEKEMSEYLQREAFEQRVKEVIVDFIAEQERAQIERQQNKAMALAAKAAPVDIKADYIRGDQNAEYSLIEYSDFECPYCKRFHKTALAFIEENPEVNWVYRHFPLNFHNPGAQKQAEAAECAGWLGGNDMFWRYSDEIYRLTTSNGKGFPVARLTPLATELGLNSSAFEKCLTSNKFREKVLNQFSDGQRAGVTGTPGNFLRHNPSGVTLPVHGNQPISKLQNILNQVKALSRQKN